MGQLQRRLPDGEVTNIVDRWHDVEHGALCECVLLARAVGADASAVDLAYCRNVLQKHWRLKCNHGCGAAPTAVWPSLPHVDLHDPVQAALLANAPLPRHA